MSSQLPSVTVLIPARPKQAEVKAAAAARDLDYPPDRLEIIVARGRQPSAQRNEGIRAANGELIYFLDDDSVVPRDGLRRAVESFRDPKVQMVGGPNLCPEDAPFLEQVFALVHASWLAFGPSRARYAAVGARRESGEKELILCNLVARKSPLLELGGFDEALYPNEENALMDELVKRGGKLMYDPQLVVFRRPRHSLKAFGKMLLNYGRGRAEQFRLHPTAGSAPNFVPPLFCAYLLLLPVLALTFPAGLRLGLTPLIVYFLAIWLQTIVMAAGGRWARSLAAIPLLVLTHILYGCGFIWGLTTTLRPGTRAQVPVELERIGPGISMGCG